MYATNDWPALPPLSALVDQVHCMDALELLALLPDASVDLIATDPPYNGVKDAAWDNQWATDAHYIAWLRDHLAQMRRVLKPNGSLYLFASPRMAARVEVAVSDYFNVLNNIRWVKREGWHQKTRKEDLRAYLEPWEAVILAEQHVSDRAYATIEYEINGAVFAPLKNWFRERVRLHGIGLSQLNAALGAATNGGGLASGYFGDKVEFQIPTPERYQQMQSAFPNAFDRDYIDLRREYEDLRREYEDLRRPFNVTNHTQYTDVWTFRTVQAYAGKHECEKPADLMRQIINASTSAPGLLLLDCFTGSGVTLDVARQLGRDYIGCDRDPHWVMTARARLAQPYTLPMFSAA
jgi:site-specific DNA-methyltransferase (adenine-specific)